MNKIKKTIITILLLLIFSATTYLSFPAVIPKDYVYAETLTELLEKQAELEAELERIRNEKSYIEGLMSEEQNKQSSLSSSISYLIHQITSTELTIQEKESAIEKHGTEIQVLGVEIENTNAQIDNVKGDIGYLEEVFKKRARTSYINSKISFTEIIASSDGFSDLVKKLKYFSAIRDHDGKLLEELSGQKEELIFYEETLVSKKKEVEEIKEQIETEKEELETAKADLAWQKEQKNQLLAESNIKEEEYNNQKMELSSEEQQKSAELSKIMDQIALASFGIGGEDVESGGYIGKQGNTGYSFGSHLHFGVYQNGYSQNPITFINNETLSWPEANPRITQYYGYTDFATKCQPADGETNFDWYTCWYGPPMIRQIANAYAYPRKYGYYPYDWDYDGYPNIHNGLDMSEYDGAPIYAAAAGKVCFGHDGFGAQYAKIDHGEGLITVYWHLQDMGLNTCN